MQEMQEMQKHKSWTTGPYSDQEALDMAAVLAAKHKNASTKAAYDKLLQRKLEAINGKGGKSRRTRRKSRHARRKSRHAGRKSRS
jgi:hypothetical protein